MPRYRRRKPRSVRAVLEGLGTEPEAIEEAERAGTAELLAIDGLVLPERGKFTLGELAEKVGAEPEVVEAFWRGLGFVEPMPDERIFTKRDVSILKDLIALTENDLVAEDLALQVARVLGHSMAQVAAAVVDASESRGGLDGASGADSASGPGSDAGAEPDADGAGNDDDSSAGSSAGKSAGNTDQHENENGPGAGNGGDGTDPGASLALRARELLPFLSDVMDYSFRRHLRAAARRRADVVTVDDGAGQIIGFADLVRFAERSLELDDNELADLVGRFDALVHEVVVGHGGRIVKMIGDAAMFTVVDPVAGACIALELADVVAADERLGGLRVGLASGPVLARDGDLYGPVVNLASRLVTVGRAGAVNVSQDVRDAIAADRRFALRSLGQRSLRHIGEVRVYRLRPGPEWGRPAADSENLGGEPAGSETLAPHPDPVSGP